MPVVVLRPVVGKADPPAVCVELVKQLLHTRVVPVLAQNLPVLDVVDRLLPRCAAGALHLARPDAILVVLHGVGQVPHRRRFHLPPGLPRETHPIPVAQRVPDRVVGYTLPVVGRQQILPHRVAVGIGDRIPQCAVRQYTGRIGIDPLLLYVPAVVVVIGRGRPGLRIILPIQPTSNPHDSCNQTILVTLIIQIRIITEHADFKIRQWHAKRHSTP